VTQNEKKECFLHSRTLYCSALASLSVDLRVFGGDTCLAMEVFYLHLIVNTSDTLALISSLVLLSVEIAEEVVVEIFFPINYEVRAYGMLVFRYDLKISFCQVNNSAVALIIDFSF
jgi:hypothetical protein